jgi:hypothetical protein
LVGRRVLATVEELSRFSGFLDALKKIVETVSSPHAQYTRLKPGANEIEIRT